MERRDLIIELFFTQYPTEFHLALTLKKGRIKNGKVKREKKLFEGWGGVVSGGTMRQLQVMNERHSKETEPTPKRQE